LLDRDREPSSTGLGHYQILYASGIYRCGTTFAELHILKTEKTPKMGSQKKLNKEGDRL